MEKFDFREINIEFNDNLGIAEKLTPAIMSQIYLKDNEAVSICESGFSRFTEEKVSINFDRPATEFDFYCILKKEERYFYYLRFFKKKNASDIYFDSFVVGIKI